MCVLLYCCTSLESQFKIQRIHKHNHQTATQPSTTTTARCTSTPLRIHTSDASINLNYFDLDKIMTNTNHPPYLGLHNPLEKPKRLFKIFINLKKKHDLICRKTIKCTTFTLPSPPKQNTM